MKTYKVELTQTEISDLTFFLLLAKWNDYVVESPQRFKDCNALWKKFITMEEKINEERLEVVD